MLPKEPPRKLVAAAVACLIGILAAELLLSIRQQSQTFDESAHLYAGYSYWKRTDFGINPEHPPLVKLAAALPLLPLGLAVQPPPGIPFRPASVVGGNQFLYSHDADALLFRARVAASVIALVLALLVFAAGQEMFGAGAALCALVLFVFEPNILANGPLVTTDIGASCGVFAAVYMFYRYVKRPSLARLLACSVVTGLLLAAKHSAILVFPIFAALAAAEIARFRYPATPPTEEKKVPETRSRQALRLAGALAVIAVISVAVLWAFYGFRYSARPGGLAITPPTATYLQDLKHPAQAGAIAFLERRHLLPEAYLYGLTDIAIISQEGRPAFLLGKLYPQGQWFYFPAAFAIKSTLGFLVLLVLLVAAKGLWRAERRRELLFILIPPLIWMGIAMTSKLDIGVRHILPAYPFLIVLAGAVAWTLMRQSRRWAVAAIALLVFHTASSLMAFPDYLPYSNEIWGGPANTHQVLADSNVGWQSGLRTLRSFLDSRHITACWFAYDGPVNPDYYHIPCKPLPTFFSYLLHRRQEVVPDEIEGPVFIGAQALSGFDWGPQEMNPYNQFAGIRPATVLHGEILVFNGNYHVPQISALSHYVVATQLSGAGHPDLALAEAQAAALLHPEFRLTHELLASLYAKNQQPEQALSEYQTALRIYRTVQPEFQKRSAVPRNPISQ